MLASRFDIEEMRLLADDIGVAWDNLRGDRIEAKASALVAWAERNDRLFTLMMAIIKARPDVDWS